MEETLTISRDWGTDHVAVRHFTLTTLLGLRQLFDLDDYEDGFVEFITGLSCDTYADQGCDIMKEVFALGVSSPDALFDQCMLDEEFQTCYTVFRLWNSHLTPELAMKEWKDSCLDTMIGLDLDFAAL